MTYLRDLLLVLHFVGLASLLGGFLVQLSAADRRIVTAMVHGAFTQLVTGLLPVGIIQGALHEPVDNAKIAVKLAVLVVITVLVWVNRARQTVSNGVYFTIGGLTLANVVIAVFWG
jgi:hypothetical protein